MSKYRAVKQTVLIISVSIMMSTAGADNKSSDHSIRVWGDISSTYRTREFDGGDSQASEWLNLTSINASTYIWRPWFALINGGIALSKDDTHVTGQESVQDEYVTGRVQFDLFPSSRFPFTAYARQSRNELDDFIFSRDITNTEFGLIQQYRSKDGRHHYRANYERNIRDDNIDSFVSDSVLLSSSNQFTHQVIYGDIQYDRVIDDLENDMATSYSITGRQSYNKANNLTIENLVASSVVDNEFISTATNIETSQFSSLLSWRPDNSNDLNVTGSFRLSEVKLESETQDIGFTNTNKQDSSILNINQGLIYNYTKQILLTESINGSYNTTQDTTRFTGNESLGATYTPDTIKSKVGNYNWSLSSTFNNQHGDGENEKSLNNQIGHSISDSYVIRKSSVIQSDLSQTFNYEYRSLNENSKTLNHSFSLNWSDSSTNQQSAVRFLASDIRNEDKDDNDLQIYNLQISGNFRFSRYSNLSSNLTLQKTSQNNNQERSDTEVVNGQLDFVRNRIFQVPRLDYRMELKFSKQQSESERLFSEFTTSQPESDVEWKNSVQYMIGRFEARFNIDYIKNNDEYDRVIKIQLNRSFGDL